MTRTSCLAHQFAKRGTLSREDVEALEDLEPEATGVGVFEMEDGSGLWEVGAYFLARPDEIALAILAAAHGARPFAVSELPETDWVAHVRRELHPVEAGRFFVYGAHDAEALPEGPRDDARVPRGRGQTVDGW